MNRIDVPAEGIEPFRIPDPSRRYFEEDEEASREKEKSSAIAREIFNIK